MCPEESEHNFSYNFSLLWSVFGIEFRVELSVSLLSAVRLSTGLLGFGTVDIWGWLILCCGGSLVHFRIFSSIPSLHSLYAGSTSSLSLTNMDVSPQSHWEALISGLPYFGLTWELDGTDYLTREKALIFPGLGTVPDPRDTEEKNQSLEQTNNSYTNSN